jgi:hypothetical protein
MIEKIQKANNKKVIWFSVGLALLFSVGLAKSARAAGASLYLAPSEGTFFVGSTFDVSVFVNTGGNDVNAVQVDLKFDPTKLQVASPTAGRSVISIWIAQPTYSNTEGTISFKGGIPTPGINTSAGLVSTITFRAIAPGTTTISFLDSCQVLLNDGKGTNILNSKGRGVYNLIIPPPEGPKVFSSTHPDQNKWYKNNNPTFSWEKEEGVTEFSYSFDQDVTGNPDNIPEGDHTSVSYSDVKDGIWYFHVKAKKDSTWGGTSHFSVQIDSTPPAGFTPIVEGGTKTSEKQPLISFLTTDALSGIDHYEIKTIDVTREKEERATGFFVEASSPYRLPRLDIGRYLIIVRAFDIAGNFQEGTVKIQIFPEGIFFTEKGIHYKDIIIPWILVFLVIFVLLLLVMVLITLFWRKRKKIAERRKKELEEIEEKLRAYRQNIDKNQL